MSEFIVTRLAELGAVLRRARRERPSPLKQAQLAKTAKLRISTVSDIENGVVTPNGETLFSLLSALDMELVIRPRCRLDADPAADWS
jgi:HTH-type transcriptional regulator/antitoxin HipB